MLLLEEAMKEDHHQPINRVNQSIIRSEDDDNAITNSHSSDVECGSVFSSSAYGKDDDSPPLIKRHTTYSGENNRDFELIEREIGMCRPVCWIILILLTTFFFSFSLKMVYVKFMY